MFNTQKHNPDITSVYEGKTILITGSVGTVGHEIQ